MHPILYSFRRCPYAIRARMALYCLGHRVELREVVLKNKPEQMLTASAKGTVPVLILPEAVIDESIEIMQWAMDNLVSTPLFGASETPLSENALIQENDFHFKPILDRYKYFERYPEFTQAVYLEQALPFLRSLNKLIATHNGFLDGGAFTAVDAAIFPFIRQFAHSDMAKFSALELPELQRWLRHCLDLPMFNHVMKKYPAWSVEQSNAIDFGDDGLIA